jgi:hypothetical protein
VQGGEKMDQPLRRAAFRTVKAGNPAEKAGPLDEFRYQVKNSDVLKEAEKLWATGLFRGHLVSAPFPFLFGEGVPVAFVRRKPEKTTIIVKGDEKRQTALMFILDCSGSMTKKVLMEGKLVPRIHVATTALKRILENLVNKPFSVGLSAYGHRVGWADENASKIVRRPRPGRNPNELEKIVPSNDVEMLFPCEPFGLTQLGRFNAELGPLHPLGETPLYLAIAQAVEHLRKQCPGPGEKRIVVITDGVNEQSGLDPEACAGNVRLVHDCKDAEDALDNRGPGEPEVRLDIVGLQIDPKDAGESKLAQLRALARGKGKGEYYDAGDVSELRKALEKSLASAQYTVEPADGEAVAPVLGKLELGRDCPLPTPRRGEANYSVRMADERLGAKADVTVEGGEALELFWEFRPEVGRRELVHHRYGDQSRPAHDKLENPLRPGEQFLVCAHIPTQDGVFRISIQNSRAERFSPRPKEMWIEIRPRFPAGHADEGRVYCFYDPNFEPSMPVPVVRCQALQWPEAAAEATIEAWFRFDLAKGEKRRAGDALNSFRLADAPEIAFEGPEIKDDPRQPTTVTLTEIHPRGNALNALKVEMQPPADKVEHRYNSKTGMVRHQFVYSDRPDVKEVRDYTIRMVTRKSLIEKAVYAPRLIVDLSRR